ncbi:MAG: tRNA (N6-threonylcarbamoyladenosine(37)-N6)-methyltransferase TrmO [Pseudodesulfovibrio sp.]
MKNEPILMHPIGVIRSPYKTKGECPIQGVYTENSRGTVELLPEHAAGLQDIEMFSHIYLFYHFDRAGEVKYVRSTFLDDREHGIYASRHPCRPNSIGMSIVKLISREGNILTVETIDVLDETPLLDIKPYMPRHDIRASASEGWVSEVPYREKPEGLE